MQTDPNKRPEKEEPAPNHHQNSRQHYGGTAASDAQGGPAKPKMRPHPSQKTKPITWCVAVFCAVFSLAVILGGIAVLAIFLAYRPRGPRLDVPTATLNAAYLDSPGASFLNADLTLLANLSNPNRKIDFDFYYLQMDLYFRSTLVATQAVPPFAERRGQSALRSVHMLSSEVALPPDAAIAWWNGTAGGGGVTLRLRGKFRTRMVLGGWLRYTYWARVRCDLTVGPPPAGALLTRQC